VRPAVEVVIFVALAAVVIALVEMVVREIRHYRRRPWWRSEPNPNRRHTPKGHR